MFEMDYNPKEGWHDPRIVPYQDSAVSPANCTIHYGQAIFEGMKAFRTHDDRIVIFRQLDHLNRLNNSARILDIQPTELHQRVPVVIGSKNEVDLVTHYHN